MELSSLWRRRISELNAIMNKPRDIIGNPTKAASNLLLAGLVITVCSPAFAIRWLPVEDYVRRLDQDRYSLIWISSDRLLALLAGRERDQQLVCPYSQIVIRQPFCRRFTSPMIGACGDHERIIILLANGELHRVNSALMSDDGSFEPTHRPAENLELTTPHFSTQNCHTSDILPEIFALNQESSCFHFDGSGWAPAITHNFCRES
jgi:hypothetical protein